MKVLQFEPDAGGDDLLFRAGGDEEQILLPVVEEPEVLLPVRAGRRRIRGARLAPWRKAQERDELLRHRRHLGALLHHEGTHPLQGLGLDPRSVAQPRNELAVVDREPAEGRFRHLQPAAERGDRVEEAFLSARRRRGRVPVDVFQFKIGHGRFPVAPAFFALCSALIVGEQPQSGRWAERGTRPTSSSSRRDTGGRSSGRGPALRSWRRAGWRSSLRCRGDRAGIARRSSAPAKLSCALTLSE